MNTTSTRFTALQPLVSTSSRIAAAVAVVTVVAFASIGAQQASHQAVLTAAQTFSQGPAHVVLAPVQVVGRRSDAKRS